MDRENAIRLLAVLKTEINFLHGEAEDTIEALDLAIEALREQTEREGGEIAEETREALMRLVMCARRECNICKYEDESCSERVTGCMHILMDALKEPELVIQTGQTYGKSAYLKERKDDDSFFRVNLDECKEQKSKLDCIRRQDVLDLAKDGKIVSNTNYKKVVAHINNIPSANDTDCISRADTIKAMCQGCKVFLDDEFNCADCADVAIVKGMPPVNQKQITGKLENAENATSDGEESTTGQPKSKLDLISRQAAMEAFCDDCRGLKPSQCEHWDSCKSQQVIMMIPALPPVKPTERTIVHDKDWIIGCIKHDGFINTTRGDKANQIILNAVRATKRTGESHEWMQAAIADRSGKKSVRCFQCPVCSKITFLESDFCPNCGAKMIGGTENE